MTKMFANLLYAHNKAIKIINRVLISNKEYYFSFF